MNAFDKELKAVNSCIVNLKQSLKSAEEKLEMEKKRADDSERQLKEMRRAFRFLSKNDD